MNRTKSSSVAVIAHRGASAQAPENTLAAFRRAAALEADMVELDVHLSLDGKLVVIHDATLERTTNGRGPVWRHTAAQLAALDAGSWFAPEYAGEGVPTLAGVFAALPPDMDVNVEVKAPGEGDGRTREELAGTLLSELRAAGDRPIIISSFDYLLLETIHGIGPSPALAYLFTAPPDSLPARVASGVLRALHPYHRHVDRDLVELAHSYGLAVNPWTVDEPDEMKRLIALGVDAIITNVPDVAKKVRGT